LKFDIYGRFQLEVLRDGEQWNVYRLVSGKRVACADIVVPSEVTEEELATYLDDLFHEGALPGTVVRVL
jgi:hypothetical protein